MDRLEAEVRKRVRYLSRGDIELIRRASRIAEVYGIDPAEAAEILVSDGIQGLQKKAYSYERPRREVEEE